MRVERERIAKLAQIKVDFFKLIDKMGLKNAQVMKNGRVKKAKAA